MEDQVGELSREGGDNVAERIKKEYYVETIRLLENYNMLKINVVKDQEEIENIIKYKDGYLSGGSEFGSSKTNNISRVVENIVIDRVDRKGKLEENAYNTYVKIDKIDRALDVVPRAQKQVIILKFFRHWKWYEISNEMHFSERWCKVLKSKAIRSISVALFGNDVWE